MFVLRNILNHELYTDNVFVEGEPIFGVGGWVIPEEAQKYATKLEQDGRGYAEDWLTIELDDKFYYMINHHLNNDSDFKAFYSGRNYFEILDTRTGRFVRFDKDEDVQV